MIKILKVLFLLPIRNDAHIFDIWCKHIYKLNPKPYKVIFCENNSKDETLSKIAHFKLPHELIRFWAIEHPKNMYDIIAHARDLLLTRARQLNPDYAVFLSTDVLIKSPNMINSLTNYKVDIVGGTAPTQQSDLLLPVLWKNPLREHILKCVRTHPRTAFEEVYALGFECVCLSRKVIQDKRLNFHPVLPLHSEDFSYCAKAHKLGYKIWLDNTVRLSHLIRTVKKRAWDSRFESLIHKLNSNTS